jgi:hypothetical protein
MDLSTFRIIVNRVLRIALPLLVFQIVFLAALPDAFGVNEDFGALSKPTRSVCFSLAIDPNPRISPQLGQPTPKPCTIREDSHPVNSPCTKKWGCSIQKAPPSWGSEGPYPCPILGILTSRQTPRRYSRLFGDHVFQFDSRNSHDITSPHQTKSEPVCDQFLCWPPGKSLHLPIFRKSKSTPLSKPPNSTAAVCPPVCLGVIFEKMRVRI